MAAWGMPTVASAWAAEPRRGLCSGEGAQNPSGHLGVTPNVFTVQREERAGWAAVPHKKLVRR